MITERIGWNYSPQTMGQLAQSVPKQDDRYSRDLQADFLEVLDLWFIFIKNLRDSNNHPDAVQLLLKFIGQDLNIKSNMF